MTATSSTNATPTPVAQRPRLLDQVRTAIRTRHYSLRTEEAYFDILPGLKAGDSYGAQARH